MFYFILIKLPFIAEIRDALDDAAFLSNLQNTSLMHLIHEIEKMAWLTTNIPQFMFI